MTANPLTGPANIEKFEITSNKGGKIDISKGVVEYRYYENVLSNFITSSVTVIETGLDQGGPNPSSLDGLPLRGGEFSDISVQDVRGNTISVPGGLYVTRVKNGNVGTEQDLYQIDFASKEYFLNEKVRVLKNYQGKISINAEEILKEVLGTTQELEIDPTANLLNFAGNSRKPFYVLSWLASKSLPEFSDGPGGYLFYQTKEKIYFKSIDILFSEAPVKKYIYNDTGIPVSGFDDNIIDYYIDSDNEFEMQQIIGAYKNKTTYFDFFNQVFKTIDYSIFEQEGAATTAGSDYINVNEELIEESSRYLFYVKDLGVFPQGVGDQQLENWRSDPTKQNFDSELALVQAKMRYNQLFTVQINITIPGDFTIQAGDIVECAFPFLENKLSKELNPQTTGIYIVGSVCHRITPSETLTSIGLIRDSFK